MLELLRRLAVNDLLGNPDAHLKNFGVLYPDGLVPRLAPAYDIVAYAAMQGAEGHALPLMPPAPGTTAAAARRSSLFTPASVRDFCFATGLHEPRVRRLVADTVRLAREHWPALIEAAALPAEWKARLSRRLASHPLLEGMVRRGR